MSEDAIRLSKRMAELGLCSRREADEMIERGFVKVDGVIVDTLGSRVRPEQKIELLREAVAEQVARVTIVLNKPIGFVCGPAEQGERPAWQLIKPETRSSTDRTGIDYLKKHHHGLAPAGWLDVDAAGLLVMTQDGRIARKLMAGAGDYEQEFLVELTGPLPGDAINKLNGKLNIDGEALAPIKASQQSDRQLRIVLRENRRRLIPEVCRQLGICIGKIRRIRVGRIAIGDLGEGQWRYLGENERF